ncbi:PilZ domain-containing protein [Sphingomonas sp. Sphisp140]|uniref:PilZ domain-containing protein n=1 Tax=unclassified Sphingomonas TaxID=196159 RepID=UPI0039AF7E10
MRGDRRGLKITQGVDRREAMRWPVSLAASVKESRLCFQNVRLVEISRAGCRIETGFLLPPGMETVLRLSGFKALNATVVWSNREAAGLRFAAPLHPGVVTHLMSLPSTQELAEYRPLSAPR